MGFGIWVRNEFPIMLHFGQPLTHLKRGRGSLRWTALTYAFAVTVSKTVIRKMFNVEVGIFDHEEGTVTTSASQAKPGCGFGHTKLC